jgi:hypothetical protein
MQVVAKQLFAETAKFARASHVKADIDTGRNVRKDSWYLFHRHADFLPQDLQPASDVACQSRQVIDPKVVDRSIRK